jgi:tape measure domain-containing protein
VRFRVAVEVGIDADLARAAARRAGQEMSRELMRALGNIDMSAASRRMAEAFRGLEPILRRLAEISRTIGAGPGLDALIRRIDALEERLRRLEGASGGAGRGLGNLGSGLASLITGVLSAGAAFKILGDSVEAAMDVSRLERGFAAVAGGAAAGGRELEFVRGVANRLGLDLRKTADDYMKLAAAAKGTALEGRQSRDVFVAISEASRVLGLDSMRTSMALNAVQQMISKGTVSAEELRGQLGENLPGAFQIAARAMGVTTAELGEMLESGEVLAEDLLPRMAAELRKTYGTAADAAGMDPSAQFARMKNAIFEAEAALGAAFVPALAEAATAFAAFVSTSDFAAFVQSLGQGISGIIQGLSYLGEALGVGGVRFREWRAAAALAAAQVIEVVGHLAAAINEKMAAAVGGFVSGLSALGPALATLLGIPQSAMDALSRKGSALAAQAAAEGAAIRRWTDDLAAGFREVADEQLQLQADSDASAKKLKTLADQAAAATAGFGKFAAGAGKLADKIADLEENYRDQIQAATSAMDAIGGFAKATLTAAERAKVLLDVGEKIAKLNLDPSSAKALELERLALEAALAAKNLEMMAKAADLIPKQLELKPINWPELAGPSAYDMGWADVYSEAIEEGTKEGVKEAETIWSAGSKAMAETLQSELLTAGQTAIEGWVEFGDSWVENLLEKLIEAFASAALQAAISSAFSGQGGGFWGSVASAFGGGGGGGGAGGGGAGWVSTLASAYRAWKGGASAWSGVTGVQSPAWTSTFINNGANGIYGPTASGGNIANGGLTTAGTAVAVAAVGAAIIYAFKLYLDKREAKQFDDTGQRFYMGYGINPNDPVNTLPAIPRGGSGPGSQNGQNNGFDLLGGGPNGQQNNNLGGLEFLGGRSTAGPIGRLNVPEIQTKGSLTNMIGAEQVEQLRKLVEENTLGLVKSLGGLVTSLGEFTLNIRNDGKEFMTTIDGVEHKFKTIEEAISAGIANMLDAGEFENLSANIENVLKNANEIGLDGLQAALDLAKQADAALAGSLSATAPAVTLFESQLLELEKQIAADTAQGLKWGISLESLNALGEKRIEQLKREQEAFAGQQVATTLEQLFALSPQAAADAELAMIYQKAVGAMRIAQLQMEADKLASLGYLTAAQMNKIQGYIEALDAAGAGAAAISGGGGPATQDPGVAQREARRAELWQMMRDLEAGGAAAIGSLQAALDKARGLGDEMRALNMGEVYADKMTDLATLAAGKDFLKPFEAVIASAGKSNAASKWDELQARYAEYQAALLAGAEQLTAAGFDVEAAMARLREAQQVEAAQLGQSLLATFGDPFLKIRNDAADLADRLLLLDQMVAAGAVSVEEAAQVHRWVAEQAFAGLAESLLGTIDRYYGDVAEFDAVRAQLEQMKFDLEIAQYRLQFELIRAMGGLTEQQIASIEEMFAYIDAHPPDFSQQPGTPPGGGGGGDIGGGSGIDQAAQNLERLMQMLRGWEDLALTPAERRLRDINEQFATMLELAGRDQAMIARVRAAYGLALKDFYDGLRAPLKDLLRDLGLGAGSTSTTRNQVLDLKAQYDALVQRLAANPNDAAALEQLNTVARALLNAASNYGQDGALYAGIAASMAAMLPRILAGTPFDPNLAAGSGANDNGPTRRGRQFASPAGTTRDPLIEQAQRDREAQSRENAEMLMVLKRIERALGQRDPVAGEVRDAVSSLNAALRRKGTAA